MDAINPKTEQGIIYDKLSISLAIGHVLNGSQKLVPVSFVAIPEGRDGNGNIVLLPNESHSFVYPDILTSSDPAALTAISEISQAIQKYLNAKNV